MAYATLAKIVSRSPVGLADLSTEDAAPAIAWAEARVNGRLRSKFSLPFSTVPDELVEIASDLAAYEVLRQRFIAGAEDTPPDAALELRNRAEEALDEILAGTVVLAVGETSAPVSCGMRSSTYGTGRSLKNFDGLSRPLYDDPTGTPLAPMVRTAPQTVDSMAGDW